MNKEQFKQYRKTLKISQKEYGKLLGGYSQKHISRVENGWDSMSPKLTRAYELLIQIKSK